MALATSKGVVIAWDEQFLHMPSARDTPFICSAHKEVPCSSQAVPTPYDLSRVANRFRVRKRGCLVMRAVKLSSLGIDQVVFEFCNQSFGIFRKRHRHLGDDLALAVEPFQYPTGTNA